MQYVHGIVVVLLLVSVAVLFGLCFFYIRYDFYLKAKQKKPVWMNRLPALDRLQDLVMRCLYVVFGMLSLLMLSGFVLAHDVWDHNWIKQPKWLFALLTWIYFLFMVIVSQIKGLRGTGLFMWLMVGCGFISLSLYGAYAW